MARLLTTMAVMSSGEPSPAQLPRTEPTMWGGFTRARAGAQARGLLQRRRINFYLTPIASPKFGPAIGVERELSRGCHARALLAGIQRPDQHDSPMRQSGCPIEAFGHDRIDFLGNGSRRPHGFPKPVRSGRGENDHLKLSISPICPSPPSMPQ